MPQETLAVKSQPKDGKAKRMNSAAKTQLSIISLVRNIDAEIREVYAALISGLEKIKRNYEIIFVDDGSTDNSWHELKKIAETDKHVKLVRMRTSFGESAAFDAGLKLAKGDHIVFFTNRVRINPLQIPDLMAKLDDGFDLVMGWRYPRRDSELNQIISRGFNWIIHKISKTTLNDVNSGVFAAKRQLLDDIPLYGNLNIFLPILADRKGYKICEVRIEQLRGSFRQSKYLAEYVQRLLDIVAVIFLTKYSKKPLHFLGFLGLIFTLIGVGMNVYLFFYRIFQFGPIAGRPLLLLGALLLVIGIQMISIGLIGEMIIFTHAKQIKEYTIEEILE